MLGVLFTYLMVLPVTKAFSNQSVRNYDLNPKGSEESCISETFRPSCQNGEVIIIDEAIFGRRKFSKCLKNEQVGLNFDDAKVVGCYSDVRSLIVPSCSLKRTCEVRVVELNADVPCYNYLRFYLEVAWSCIKVLHDNSRCGIAVGLERYHMLSPATSKTCGCLEKPWTVEAHPGQRLLIQIISYNAIGSHDDPTSIFFASNLSLDTCNLFGRIKDGNGQEEKSICFKRHNQDAISTRERILISKTNSIKIMFETEKFQSQKQRYILSLEATGCSDLIPPTDAWLKRTENEATIGCYSTRLRWKLNCDGQRWIGVIGNCSKESMSAFKPDMMSLPNEAAKFENQVVTIASIITIGIVLCLMIACLGVVLLKKYYALKKIKILQRRTCELNFPSTKNMGTIDCSADGTCNKNEFSLGNGTTAHHLNFHNAHFYDQNKFIVN